MKANAQSEPRVLTPDEKARITADFEETGFATFVIGSEREEYEALLDYTRRTLMPTWTDIDRQGGTITVHRRIIGTMEGFF